MYLVHLELVSTGTASPTQADAERIEDRIWARAGPRLGIQHLHARAGPHSVHLAVFFAGTGPVEPFTDADAPMAEILVFIPEWTVRAEKESPE